MKINKSKFTIDIKATPQKIWDALWSDTSYRKWASVFFEGSYAVTDNWKVGSHVMFLAPDESGIYSLIETHIPNQVMGFKHIGNVVKGKEQPIDEATKTWTGASEIYTLTEGEGHITLTVDIDIMDEHLDYMTKTFSKALEVVKQVAEN